MSINGGDAVETGEHGVSSAAAEEMRLLGDVIRSLPPVTVKDLISMGVCAQCIVRLLGKYGPSYSHPSHILRTFSAGADHHKGSDERVMDNEQSTDGTSTDAVSSRECPNKDDICCICCGILQFCYVNAKETFVKYDCANDLALSISEMTKQEGYQVDGFSLEVSLPPVVLENENAVRLFMKKKYGAELWFREMLQSESISVKDALKLFITEPLETLLGVKCGSGSFRIRLTYTCCDTSTENNQACKRRKTGDGDKRETGNLSADGHVMHPNSSTIETNVALKKCVNILQDQKWSESFKTLQEKVSVCRLALLWYRTPIYIGGRYLKYSRNVSQTRWIIDDERMGEASVEEIVSNNILPFCRGDNYKFHAAGREDIDVRMLGSGRPFLVEIQNSRVVPSEVLVKEMEMKINSSKDKLVEVKNLRVVDDQVWTLMREGEAEKQKQYAALVWISRQLEDKDLQTISSLMNLTILQRTPVRVLHRRSPLEREKIIHWMNIEKVTGSSQYFLLHLCTQAGTYIKEFVHGDFGRTNPSIGSILGCRAEILQLDVTDVKMDCFLAK